MTLGSWLLVVDERPAKPPVAITVANTRTAAESGKR